MLLFFNDVSGSEVLVILIFILIFFGSKSIPGIARTFGRTIHQIKSASTELQDEIRKSGVDMKKDLNLTSLIQDSTADMAQPLDQMASDLDQSIRFEPPKKHLDAEVNIVENVMPPSHPASGEVETAEQNAMEKEVQNAIPNNTEEDQKR